MCTRLCVCVSVIAFGEGLLAPRRFRADWLPFAGSKRAQRYLIPPFRLSPHLHGRALSGCLCVCRRALHKGEDQDLRCTALRSPERARRAAPRARGPRLL